jgi:Rps23 Pro-64 3,4-dihydroxylase Tpa1-like proline 4-hydroxylase
MPLINPEIENFRAVKSIFPYEKWQALPAQRTSYLEATPFPYIVLDDFLDQAAVKRAMSSFPLPLSADWVDYRHHNSKKLGQNKREFLPQACLEIIDELCSEPFLEVLRELTGIPNLVADPALEGGGIHQISRGGYLNIHADFTSHSQRPLWARRLNLLVYLNEGWKEEYGGQLELWDRNMGSCRVKILPLLNRCVIFNTDKDTFHGHPDPLTCPENITRKSIALYYFTAENSVPLARSTEYRSRPGDSLREKTLIFLDKQALRAYDFGRRRLGISDALVSKILKWFR